MYHWIDPNLKKGMQRSTNRQTGPYFEMGVQGFIDRRVGPYFKIWDILYNRNYFRFMDGMYVMDYSVLVRGSVIEKSDSATSHR